jgi:hypothetical protein
MYGWSLAIGVDRERPLAYGVFTGFIACVSPSNLTGTWASCTVTKTIHCSGVGAPSGGWRV